MELAQGTTTSPRSTVHVLLICALHVEYEGVLGVTEGIVFPGWRTTTLSSGTIVSDAQFTTPSGLDLKIRASWASNMGREYTQALIAKSLVEGFSPDCLAMSGVCAGRRGKIELGDAIFVARFWSYDAGKTVVEDGVVKFEGDIVPTPVVPAILTQMQAFKIAGNESWLALKPALTLEYQESWVMALMHDGINPLLHPSFKVECPNWVDVRNRLEKKKWIQTKSATKINFQKLLVGLKIYKGLSGSYELASNGIKPARDFSEIWASGAPSVKPFELRVAPLATGAEVKEDEELFPRLGKSMRGVLGVDMEASGLATTANALSIPCVVVKCVQDFADPYKDDRYREFSTRASAECLIAFLRKCTEQLAGASSRQSIARGIENVMVQNIPEQTRAEVPTDLVDEFVLRRLQYVRTRRIFAEANTVKDLGDLHESVLAGNLIHATIHSKCEVARDFASALARTNQVDKAKEILEGIRALDSMVDLRVDEARIQLVNKNYNDVLLTLRDINSPLAVSLIYEALVGRDGWEEGVRKAGEYGYSVNSMSAFGKLALAIQAQHLGNYEQVYLVLRDASKSEIEDCPAILTIRANAALLLCRPAADRPEAGLQLVLLNPATVRFSDEPEKILLRASALTDMQTFLTKYSDELEVPQHSGYVEENELWLRLSHSDSLVKNDALNTLKKHVEDAAQAVRWARFAFSYNVEVDVAKMSAYLAVRKGLGGWSSDELIAALLVSVHSNNSADVLELLSSDRAALAELIGASAVVRMEVEAVARMGQFDAANALIEDHKAQLSEGDRKTLTNLVSETAGGNALDLRRQSFANNPGASERLMLVEELVRSGHEAEAAGHLTEYFSHSPSIKYAKQICYLFVNSGSYRELRDFLDRPSVSKLLDQSSELETYDAWSEYFEGRLAASFERLSKIQAGTDNAGNISRLKHNLFAECGDWDGITALLLSRLENKNNLQARELLEIAETGRITGLSSALIGEVISLAGEKASASQDAGLLAAAYQSAVKAGLERKNDAVHDWFSQALALSNDDGPFRQGSFSEVLDLAEKSRKHSDYLNGLIATASAPLALIAGARRSTLSEIVFGILLGNEKQLDASKKIGLPLYAGNRLPESFARKSSIGVDRSTLMILGYLNMLEPLSKAFEKIVIARGSMPEFMKDVAKAKFHQPSRVDQAKRLSNLFISDRVKVVKADEDRGQFDAKVLGEPLRRLLSAASSQNGVVVVAQPIFDVQSRMERVVDITPFKSLLVGPRDIIDELESGGMIGTPDANNARSRLPPGEINWTDTRANVSRDKSLYLDGAILDMLDGAGVLDQAFNYFQNIYTDISVRDDAYELIAYLERQDAITTQIESIRLWMLGGIRSGKIVVSPQTKTKSERLSFDSEGFSLQNFVANPGGSDIALFDDRSLNKVASLTLSDGKSIPLASTLDLLKSLFDWGQISSNDVLIAHKKLRKSGALYVPIASEELAAAALGSDRGGALSYDLRMLADYIDSARIANVLQLPDERIWIGSVRLAVLRSIGMIWSSGRPLETITVASNRLLSILPNAFDWMPEEAEDSLIPWATDQQVPTMLILGQAPDSMEESLKDEYFKWVESWIDEMSPLDKAKAVKSAAERIRNLLTNTTLNG